MNAPRQKERLLKRTRPLPSGGTQRSKKRRMKPLAMLSVAISLTHSTASAQVPELTVPKLRPPELITIPDDVPAPLELADGTWLLQPMTAMWLARVLFGCRKMPGLFELGLAENDAIWRVVLRGSLNAARAQDRADRIAEAAEQAASSQGEPQWWYVWAGVIAAAALGAALGMVAGFVAAQ